MHSAREEVRELSGTSGDDIADILISCVLLFNDGAVSLMKVLKRLKIEPSSQCQTYLKKKDRVRARKSAIKASIKDKQARRAARRRRKGFEDQKKTWRGCCMQLVPLILTALDQVLNSEVVVY